MPEDHYWAGVATVRVRAAEDFPGFARLRIHCEEGEPRSLSGMFVAGGATAALANTIAAELLLPGEMVARANISARHGELFNLEGVLPWPQWRLLTDDVATPLDASVAETKSGILEVRAGRRITARNWLRSEDLPLEPGVRLLMDYRQVQEILVPLEWFETSADALEALGARVALVASNQVAVGLLRQTRRRGATTDPGACFQLFRDYSEARLWLLGDD